MESQCVCTHIFYKGQNKGKICGQKAYGNSTLCAKHTKNITKKECFICFNEKNETTFVKCTTCEKESCRVCIKKWFKKRGSQNRCPFCRSISSYPSDVYPVVQETNIQRDSIISITDIFRILHAHPGFFDFDPNTRLITYSDEDDNIIQGEIRMNMVEENQINSLRISAYSTNLNVPREDVLFDILVNSNQEIMGMGTY